MTGSNAKLVLVACLLLAGRAAAGRTLRQYTHSMTGSSIDKSKMLAAYSSTDYADARSQPDAQGPMVTQATVVATSSYHYPGPQSKGGTIDLLVQSGPATEATTAVFRTAAIASTDNGAVAASTPDAMQIGHPPGTPGTASAITLNSMTPMHSEGIGVRRMVRTASTGTNLAPSNSLGISDVGDGPHAISSAGDAVASSYAAAMAP